MGTEDSPEIVERRRCRATRRKRPALAGRSGGRDGPGSVVRLAAEAPPGGGATKRIDDNDRSGVIDRSGDNGRADNNEGRRRFGFGRRLPSSLPRDPPDPGQVTRVVRSGSRALRIPQCLRQTFHEGVLDSVPVRET